MNELKVLSYDLRKHVVDMIIAGKGGHIGGDMSVMEILVELYMKQMNISPENKDLDNRDRFVLSKGHSVESYYAVLAKKGFFPMEEVISTFSQFGSKFIGHPNNKLPGIEMNSGSLGHGLPVCVGMAMAGKMDRKDYRVYVVMGDGELAEGSVWEGAMAASHYCLDNLCAVVDVNGLQIDGATADVMPSEPLDQKFEAFNWNVIRVDGHDYAALAEAFAAAAACKGKPTVLLARTVKGKGVSFMEGDYGWHGKAPNAEQYEKARAELAALRQCCDVHGLFLYLDGARLGSALTSPDNDLTLPELAALTHAFTIGGTKNGALFGEALVLTRPMHHFRWLM